VEDKGEGLYDTLKLEFERCTGQLSKILTQLDVKGIEWIRHFVDVCEWFNTQTVCTKF
jgi:cullin-4